MELLDTSVRGFNALLASQAAVPGGGGASALAGAVGVALGSMVGALTVGKRKYAAVEEDVKALMVRAEELRLRLETCVAKDAAAFEPLAAAYGIPKDDPAREGIMERCLRDAAAAPMEIMELCCEAIALQRGFADMGSALAISDAATGAALLRGALCGAAANVRVNTRLMHDRESAAALNARVDKLLADGCRLADAVYEDVSAKLR